MPIVNGRYIPPRQSLTGPCKLKPRNSCTNCLACDCELSRCSKCKGVWYCSKECQLQHWPKHKLSCSNGDPGDFYELFTSGFTNPIFNGILQACFVLAFDLLCFPSIDKPFLAQVKFGIK
ncbi:hypothetical protein C8R44DRAFT_892739 [Mycena epipterygia]|nr:hypothetical protein C8R44DRAFT_892739 [Mycena epipterygia]